jgi:hypothetical protein
MWSVHPGWRDAAGQPLTGLPHPGEVEALLRRFCNPGSATDTDITLITVNLDDGFITAARLAEPTIASGRCFDVSDMLARDIAKGLPAADPRDGDGQWVGYGRYQIGERGPHRSGIREHHAVVVATSDGPHMADLTARQFGPALPFPLFEPLATYAARGRWWTSLADLDLPDPRTDPPERNNWP